MFEIKGLGRSAHLRTGIMRPRKARETPVATALNVNGKIAKVDADPDKPLLWVLRENLGILGPKFGCGIGACGACTVHLNGQPVRSCITPVSAVGAQRVTTIDQLAADPVGRKVQAAWAELDVAQCGYCQAGQIMSATALLKETPKPTDAQIDAAMSGNICRCGTYNRIRAAIHRAAGAGTGVAAAGGAAAGRRKAAAGKRT